MQSSGFDVVTGAFGYTGRHIAQRLLAEGRRVTTLTSRPQPAGLYTVQLPAFPLTPDADALTERLRGADTLYNTYWVRFHYGSLTHDTAVETSAALIEAAKRAGVRRMVHVSIANANAASPLTYYRGKGQVEGILRASGISYAIVRPTLIFGDEDILINNIAWFLRRFPVFGLPGSGDYLVRPVHVDDVAALAVKLAHADDNPEVDAAGPDVMTFASLVHQIAEAVGGTTNIIPMHPRLAHLATMLVGRLIVHDEVLTWEEILGLSGGLLTTDSPTTGETRFSDWLQEEKGWLGTKYRSELRAHYR